MQVLLVCGRLVCASYRSMVLRNYCFCSHQLASAKVKREANSVTPPLLVIASTIDQTLTVPPRDTNRPLVSNNLRRKLSGI